MKSATLSRSFFTQIQIAALAVVLSFVLVGITMPSPARAAGLTEEQVKAVVTLLESFDTDQATLMRVQKALGGPVMPGMSSTTLQSRKEMGVRPLCALLKRELGRGSRGDDVRELQKILAEDKDIYAEGEVTGFFGERTEAAVKRLQAKLDIVAAGDATSTGYGRVGAKTRAALVARCMGERGDIKMLRPMEDRAGTSSRIRYEDGRRVEENTTSYVQPSAATYLLASAATSMAAPFNLVTDLLSDTLLSLGLY